MMQEITLKDVAQAAGYSVTTVSRALSGYDDVNEVTRKHIVDVAEQLGYRPNSIARQLQSKRTNTIGIITSYSSPDDEDDYYSMLVRGISHIAAQNHYDVLLSTQVDPQQEMKAYHRIAGGRRVDGMILARNALDDERIAYLESIKHPFVLAGRGTPGKKAHYPYIDADSELGVRMLVEHFIDYGYRDIGLILSPENLIYTTYRLQGYKQGLAAAGIPFEQSHVIVGDLSRDSGVTAMQMLLKRVPHLNAVVACNDMMAFGAMWALRDMGLNIGSDVAVGGFDDITPARYASPSLTTIRQPIFEIGELLAQMLIKLIDEQPISEQQILVKPELIIRGSSGQPRR